MKRVNVIYKNTKIHNTTIRSRLAQKLTSITNSTTHKKQTYRQKINGKTIITMLIFMAVFFVKACLAGTIPATPENITVTFLTPTTVRVSWQTMIDQTVHPVEKYIVTYKPTDDRVVQDVAGNSEAIILDRLSPSTQYSLAVTAIYMGEKYRSRQIIFKTLDLPKNTTLQDFPPGIYTQNGNRDSSNMASKIINGSIDGDDVTSTNTFSNGTTRELPTVRGVEIGIVLIVLMVWAGAIALFFNRWGKIRMLLPYQPDYKHEQLKVPGTGVCTTTGCTGQHSHQCLPRCEGCGLFDRCFQYPRRELERDCGCQFALLHRAETES